MATYQVGGVVSCAVRTAVGGLHVSIVDKNVTGDIELASATTGDLGAYSASFDDAELKTAKKTLPDLQARVFAGETFLEILDVVLAPACVAPAQAGMVASWTARIHRGTTWQTQEK
jgi:hypothetical protein